MPVGTGLVTDYGQRASFLPAAHELLDAADAAPRAVEGVPPGRGGHVEVQLAGKAQRLAGGTADTFGTATVVADALPPLLPDQVGADQRAAADRVLARGGVVIFAQRRSTLDRADLVVIHRAATKERPGRTERVSFPAYVVDTGRAFSPATSVLSAGAARRLSLHVAPTALLFDAQRLDAHALDELTQALQGLSPSNGRVYVERGYQVPGTQQVVLWILFGMALVLMLGGTLTATFLALSDARPDLATLSAVGASPRTRRGVAAAYAVAVGLVGAVLGAAVGFIPGIAISYPLTRTYALVGPSHYLDIPWTLIAVLVVGLPLFTALVVGLLARSRLPVVARLD